ncbi:DNA topoisomerase IB [Actinoallomurus sp. NPDC052308]|uniref:DNA topoisomerase IB n=1 Tax=Actinoallomurus sp. NPDC052308 TaxID=3155530 RepID=UPI0034462CA6
MELSRSDLGCAGIRRIRCGRGFRYVDPDGEPVRDPETLARVKALVIPPAWENVWICPNSDGHIQAVGTDTAGRRQYRYHDLWREQRDREKHDRVLEFGRVLPRLRERVERDLGGRGLTRDRVLAAAVRLIDLGFFRPGGEEYAAENGTYGLATIRKEHVSLSGGQIIFDYVAKGSKQREQAVADDDVCAVVRSLKRRRSGGQELLAYRSGPRWHDVTSADINDHLRELSGGEFSAKDFRTWHATVLAAVGLAVSERAAAANGTRKRAVARVVREVADYLGNTPAVARASYIDPRVIELYERGVTIAPILGRLGENGDFGDLATRGPAERAVLKLLTEHG